MKQFFVVFFANLLAILVVLSIPTLLLILLVASASVSSSSLSDGIVVPDGCILVLDMSLNLTDSPEHDSEADPLKDALNGGSKVESIPLRHVILAIRHAAKDDKIKALFLQGSLQPDGFGTGYSNLIELRSAIADFQQKGKQVYAYLENPDSKDYFLACISNTIFMNPYGEMQTAGIAAEKTYFKKAFDKYGIEVQVTRVGKYKSAVEPFILDKMSDADREETNKLITNIWDGFLSTVCASRKLSNLNTGSLQALIDQEGYIEAVEAKDKGLVDELLYRGQVYKKLGEIAKNDIDDGTPFKQIALRDYYNATRPAHTKDAKVAVLYLEGEIVDGDGDESNIGGERFAEYLRYLAADPNTKAVVLRVNSPGGSAFASEVIQHEIIDLEKTGKPVVVSMGNYAASGGYWISAYSDRIFAEPSTITGSIGVFGMFFNVKGLADKLGVTTDTEKVGQFSDFETIFRPKTDVELKLAQDRVDDLYHKFVSKVSKGRNIDEDKVEEIAQGRVWTGQDALKLRLVDQIGGLDDAISYAANKAELTSKSYSVTEYPRVLQLAEKLALAFSGRKQPVMEVNPLSQLQMVPQTGPLLKAANVLQEEMKSMRDMNDPAGVYARLPMGLDHL